jgi:hypothetical protein
LSLQLELGEKARRHLTEAVAELGPWSDPIGILSGLVVVNLQLGDIDEAERWLDQAEANTLDESGEMVTFHLGARGEILLARGEIDAGLRIWRRAAEISGARSGTPYGFQEADVDPWMVEVHSAAVIAHVRGQRLHLVEDLADGLARKVSSVLATPNAKLPSFVMEFPVCGAALLALAFVDIDRGATELGARMIALAQRFRFVRNFQPTMSGHRARVAAENADKPAYDDAVSSYAGLDPDELRAAALTELQARAQWQPADPAHVR